MAKKIPVRDLTLWEQNLAFFPSELKNDLWMAQFIFFQKKTSAQFLSTKRWEEYMKLERLELNTQDYINMIDPPTPKGGGGKAEFFAADFKEIPRRILRRYQYQYILIIFCGRNLIG